MPDWFEVAYRTFLAVIILFIMTKLLGKRQISQLSLFEYITGITIGSLAAYISLDMDAEWYLGIVSLVVWVGFSLIIEWIQLKSKKFRDFIDGKATVLIKKGKILEDNLKKERLTSDELMEKMRNKMIFKVADVEFGMIEPNGEINFLLKSENQPLTAKTLGITVSPGKEPQVVVMDGKMLNDPLSAIGLNPAWLKEELYKRHTTVDKVFLAQVHSNNQLTIDLFDDQLN